MTLSKVTQKNQFKMPEVERVEEPGNKKKLWSWKELKRKTVQNVLCESCLVLNRFAFLTESSIVRLVVNSITKIQIGDV